MDIQVELRKIIEELKGDDKLQGSEEQTFYQLETGFHAIVRDRGCSTEQALTELRKLYGL